MGQQDNDNSPKRQYPPLYEKLIPVALGIIVVVIVILLLIIFAVVVGIFPGSA